MFVEFIFPTATPPKSQSNNFDSADGCLNLVFTVYYRYTRRFRINEKNVTKE